MNTSQQRNLRAQPRRANPRFQVPERCHPSRKDPYGAMDPASIECFCSICDASKSQRKAHSTHPTHPADKSPGKVAANAAPETAPRQCLSAVQEKSAEVGTSACLGCCWSCGYEFFRLLLTVFFRLVPAALRWCISASQRISGKIRKVPCFDHVLIMFLSSGDQDTSIDNDLSRTKRSIHLSHWCRSRRAWRRKPRKLHLRCGVCPWRP